MVAIHGEYESGSTLGFYLKRADVHILEGRSSNLWYGSFFPDAPKIFETPESFRAKWSGPQRIFLWQSLTDPPNQLPAGEWAGVCDCEGWRERDRQQSAGEITCR